MVEGAAVHPVVYLPLLLPVVAAVAARRVADRLDPRLATWVLTVSTVLLAAASGLVATLAAAQTARDVHAAFELAERPAVHNQLS
jgi:hypothetical protein